MAIQDNTRIFDGYSSVIGGQDAGKNPNLIGQDQLAEIENCVCRGGSIKTRPGINKMIQSITNPLFSYDSNGFRPGFADIGLRAIDWFSDAGLFQCASYYAPPNAEPCIMVSIGGRLFRCVPRPNNVMEIDEIPIPVKQNRWDIPLAYMVQADRFHITQDGESLPIIFDGTVARRATAEEVPVGKQMAYGMGRLVVVRPNSREIIFGDLYGSHATDPSTGDPVPGIIGDPGASVLRFSETKFLAEGGSSTVPFALGDIVSAIFYPQQDTASGNGELLVFCEKGMASFFLSLPREQWKDSNFQRLGLLAIGGRGHRTFTAINGDIWFRSEDGWRSYRQARAEIQGWAHLPLSSEVENILKFDTEWLLQFGSAVHFDNRLLMTCNPIPNQRYSVHGTWGYRQWPQTYHDGLLALDFDVLSSFGDAKKPAWDGHWSNLKSYQIVVGVFDGVERAFAFGISDTTDHGTAVFEITKDAVKDYNGAISSSFITRSFDFSPKSGSFNEKELYDGDAWHNNIRADTDVTVQYRPDQAQEWQDWKTYSLEPKNDLNLIDDVEIPTNQVGFKPRRSFNQPANFTDDETDRVTKRGYEFQVKLAFTGNTEIQKLRIHAISLPEETTSTY